VASRLCSSDVSGLVLRRFILWVRRETSSQVLTVKQQSLELRSFVGDASCHSNVARLQGPPPVINRETPQRKLDDKELSSFVCRTTNPVPRRWAQRIQSTCPCLLFSLTFLLLLRLAFRRGVFRLFEERSIPAREAYWIQAPRPPSYVPDNTDSQFWSLPETAADIFSLISPTDIRRVRDSAPENLETLLLALTSRLFALRHHPAFPDAELAPAKEALNCIRVLTRIFPFLFETDDLEAWQNRFWWAKRNTKSSVDEPADLKSEQGPGDGDVLFDREGQQQGDTPSGQPPSTGLSSDAAEERESLAEELLDTLLDFLSFSGFSVPTHSAQGGGKVTMAIW
jgi:High-temperature-induced dauer-formation protein